MEVGVGDGIIVGVGVGLGVGVGVTIGAEIGPEIGEETEANTKLDTPKRYPIFTMPSTRSTANTKELTFLEKFILDSISYRIFTEMSSISLTSSIFCSRFCIKPGKIAVDIPATA